VALVYPLNLLTGFPGWTTDFELVSRQEQSRVAGGRTYVKDLGSPLWHMKAQTASLSANVLDGWQARLNALENGLQTFLGWKMSRGYPIAYPKGSWPTGASFNGVGTVGVINTNRKAISAAGFPPGFKFSVGDFVQIGAYDLHQVMEAATTGQFEIRPHLWPGVSAGAALKVVKPSCLMAIIPASVTATAEAATGRGVITFEALEAR
jgi:hypothetical protein